MRYSELEADFGSVHGDPVLETPLPLIEKAAGEVYTREVFLLFQPVLRRACTCTVVDSRQALSLYFFTVMKYPKEHVEWQVSFCPSTLRFKCSCERLESLGIVCEHVVAVLVYLNIVTLPDSLVINRWTKHAKDVIVFCNPKTSLSIEPTAVSKFSNVVERCKRMAVAVVKCGKPQLMRSTLDLVDAQTKLLEDECNNNEPGYVYNQTFFEETILNPSRVRTKGCGVASISSLQLRNRVQRRRCSGQSVPGFQGKNIANGRKPQTCGVCSTEGHNRTSCPILSQNPSQLQDNSNAVNNEDGDYPEEYGNLGTVDMVSQLLIVLYLFIARITDD
jgi:hypothetical protein